MSYKLCPDCGQPMLRRGQKRKHPDDYRHASGCPRERKNAGGKRADDLKAKYEALEKALRDLLSSRYSGDPGAVAEATEQAGAVLAGRKGNPQGV